MIHVENIIYEYPTKRALDDVSFHLKKGTTTALVGPNGAGKTTLLRCLAALDSPFSGMITIDGWDIEKNPREIHKISGYLSDFYGLYDELTVEQSLTYIALSRLIPKKDVDKKVRLAAQSLEIIDCLSEQAGNLSRGLRQRLAIAQALVHQPKILFLDEPASGLDPEARYALSLLLRKLQTEGMTLLISSHILAELEEYSTQMLILREGKIAGFHVVDSSKPAAKQLQEVYMASAHKQSNP